MNRRSANRFPLKMKATVEAVEAAALAEPLEAWTRDMSRDGFFLELAQPLALGARVNLTLQLVSETERSMLTIRCRSRVVRVAEAQGGRTVGVGAVIEDYELVRPAESRFP